MSGSREGALRSRRAQALVDYIGRAIDFPYARIDGVETGDDHDVVDLTVEPQLPQDRTVPIAAAEPIRLSFPVDDANAPSVYSRRDDFPIDLVHTNFDRSRNGVCLCIWEENWADLRRALIPQALVERIRDWFARTARGELHQAGQPLERLIPAVADTLIIPFGPPPPAWHLCHLLQRDGAWTAVLAGEQGGNAPPGPPRLAVFTIELPPHVHGALHLRPTNLEALRALVQPMGTDLVQSFGEWLLQPDQLRGNDRLVLILIYVPKLKQAGGQVESWEVLAFNPLDDLRRLGEIVGRTYAMPEGGQSGRRIPAGPVGDLSEVALLGWRVVQRLDRRAARVFAGNPAPQDNKLVAIGAGAIGSNVILNTTRAGIGTWTIIDGDVVLPHNTVRQAQHDLMIGFPKAETAKVLAEEVLAEKGCTHIRADVLNPGDEAENIQRVLADADLAVDFSASPAVLGRIADARQVRRAASLFFNPDGSDLVLLAEDAEREIRLDEIEAQYFLAAAVERDLDGHLGAARLDLLRYANACQDLSRPLPPWQVHTLCGIAGGRLLALLRDSAAVAKAWRLAPSSAAVKPVAIKIAGVHRRDLADFRVTVSEKAVRAMRALRREAAPDETGGVLLGCFDASRRVVHVVAALPAPADSRQAPTYFVRGARDLKPMVDGLVARSAGTLAYVGEWHSHPDGAAARPSHDDEEVFRHLKAHLDPTGAPYVLAICGKGEAWLRAGWQFLGHGEAAIAYERG